MFKMTRQAVVGLRLRTPPTEIVKPNPYQGVPQEEVPAKEAPEPVKKWAKENKQKTIMKYKA